MAKKKAPAAEGEGGDAAAPKSKKKLIIIIAAAAVLLVGGGAGGFFFMKGKGGHGAAEASSHDGGGHGAADAHGDQGKGKIVFLDVRDLTVNLSAEPGQQKGGFLKLRVALELKDSKTEADVKPLLPRVEDSFQTYMRELRPSDLAGSAGLYRLREELLRRVNVAIHPAKADAVLFKELVVQ